MGRRRTHEPASDYGRYLAAQLQQHNLEPAELAERAGLSVSHVYQLLRGDRADPRAATLRKVAAALGTSQTDAGVRYADAEAGENAVDKATFFSIMSAFPSGVTVLTTLDPDGRPKGLTCTSTCSLSAEPPLLLVCIDGRSSSLPALRQSGRFVVNYLLAGRGDLSNRFASRDQDRWQGVAWRATRSGMPWLHADSLAYAECTLVQEMPGGDHVVVIGRVDGGQPPAPGTKPLMYFRRSYATWPH
jgi:flavin reductase (DIM6/NTAB) family NADH-FMN oxidoreductase RutF